MEKSCRIEGIRMGRDGPRGYCWKKASHRQIFIVGFLQNCGEKEPACSTVFDWVQRFASGTATAQLAVREWRHSTAGEWFRAENRKLPWKWQRCIGEHIDLAVLQYSA